MKHSFYRWEHRGTKWLAWYYKVNQWEKNRKESGVLIPTSKHKSLDHNFFCKTIISSFHMLPRWQRKIILHAAWSHIFLSLSGCGISLLFPWEMIPKLDSARTHLAESFPWYLPYFFSVLYLSPSKYLVSFHSVYDPQTLAELYSPFSLPAVT